MGVEIRPYDPEGDGTGLYRCKIAFERGLGANTGGDDKAAAYEDKLTEEYRESWLAWVDRCIADDERCVTVAVDTGADTTTASSDTPTAEVVGYVFLLPQRLAHVWDAAVLNELYVAPAHRGTGVADDLVEAAFDVAADQTLPLDRVVLDVDPANERARAFYERHGFEGWGEMVSRPIER